MKKFHFVTTPKVLYSFVRAICLVLSLVSFTNTQAQTITVSPIADAYVRDGSTATTNFGSDVALIVKSSTSVGSTRFSYLKFPVNVSKVRSAKLRLYGRNIDNTSLINVTVFGVNDDSWTESGINFNNAPTPLTSNKLSSISVNDIAKYYELDVTDFVKFQSTLDGIASFQLKDMALGNKIVSFNSKENLSNTPQLVIDTSTVTPSNASLFIENPDLFPSNNDFIFSRVQIPWTRDTVYNDNHDSVRVRIRNKGISPLIITGLSLSNDTTWKILRLNNTVYVPGAGLPATISSGGTLDVSLKFIATDQAVRVKVLNETLTITSNDDKYPVKAVNLRGLWQKQGEGSKEPYAQEIINAFGFKTKTGFNNTDPNVGDSTTLKGDEIKPSYFLRANPALPVTIRQMSAYHGCCQSAEKIQWYVKGSNTLTTVFTHIAKDGQSLLPRRSSSGSPASGSINPTTPFGFKVGSVDWTDATKTPGNKIGIRVWKVFDGNGNIVPNAYIISNDYLGSSFTNYDYNDNTYYVTNIKPEIGSVSYSLLTSTPSSLDFGTKNLGSNDSLTLTIQSQGQVYPNGSSDPAIKISSIDITGENRFEFSAAMPALTTLNPQQSTTIQVKFKPLSQGLKIADLLIYYNNSTSPLRVPLYGIAKNGDTSVVVNYRIKSGFSAPITVNGNVWSADTPYAFDNLEPFSNAAVKNIAGTDDDSLYFKEQSSNGDKKPFRYKMKLPNGNYVVRLHFAEVYWGAPGNGLSGGAGSRVMSVKMEGQYKLINYDIVGDVGTTTAVIKNIPVTVADDTLNIDFSASTNRPSLCAVEVYSFVPSAPRPAGRAALQPSIVTEESVKVFPNPLHKALNIEFSGKQKGNTTIQIVDLFGRKYDVAKTTLKGVNQVMHFDISRLSLNAGVYFLKIIPENNKTELIKLVIK